MKRRYLDENESALAKKCLVIINKIKKALSGETYREYLREHPDRISLKNISFSGLESALSAALSVKTVKDADRAVRAYLSLRRERDEIQHEIQQVVPQLRGNVVAIRLLYALLSVLGVLLNSLKMKIEIEEYIRKKQIGDGNFLKKRDSFANFRRVKMIQSRRRKSIRRMADRRYMDYRVRAVRRCDGVKDIAQKVKDKATELYNQFKAMPNGQKVAKCLALIVKCVAGIYAAKSVVDLKTVVSKLNEAKKTAVDSFTAFEAIGPNANAINAINQNYANEAGNIAGSAKKAAFLKQGFKVLIALVTALIAHAGEAYVKANNNPEERGSERR